MTYIWETSNTQGIEYAVHKNSFERVWSNKDSLFPEL